MTKQQLQKTKPIIFDTESVRGIIDGRKTAARQVIKLPDGLSGHIVYEFGDKGKPANLMYAGGIKTPKYQVGDFLYVRETWNYGYVETSDTEYSSEAWFEEIPLNYSGEYIKALSGFIYKASNNFFDDEIMETVKWRPSIHMPKEAARIFLEVTGVRVERLQDITPADCHKEGVMNKICSECLQEIDCRPQSAADDFCGGFEIIIDNFAGLWNSKTKDLDKYGWESNPFVFVYEFKRVEVDNA